MNAFKTPESKKKVKAAIAETVKISENNEKIERSLKTLMNSMIKQCNDEEYIALIKVAIGNIFENVIKISQAVDADIKQILIDKIARS